jgi:hypothetical protein
MTTTRFGLEAKPTFYKGFTFRSRLEARWAIAMDEMKVRWEYEPEGLQIDRYTKFGYLPDFYLPELDCFAEVKGSLNSQETIRLMEIVGAITAPKGGRPYEDGGRPFILLGNFQTKDFLPPCNSLYSYKGKIVCLPNPSGFVLNDVRYGFSGSGFDLIDEGDFVSDCCEDISQLGIDISWISDYLCNGNSKEIGSFHIQNWSIALQTAITAQFQDGHYV